MTHSLRHRSIKISDNLWIYALHLLVATVLICCFSLSSIDNAYAKPSKHLYSTGTALEVDRCASAWLIKRFVDKDATFIYSTENSLITEGVVFDRPEGNLQRTHNAATFEIILEKYAISERRLLYMAELIHDVEINFWGKKNHPESREMKGIIQKMIDTAKNHEDFYTTCFKYFDTFYSNLTIPETK